MTAPEKIGLVGDGFGMWALAHNSEADIAVLYTRSDLIPALIAEAVERERAVFTEAIETYFDATAVMDVENYAAAIRAREQE
jgi:hypothetical protein